jgi:hypothetical protein
MRATAVPSNNPAHGILKAVLPASALADRLIGHGPLDGRPASTPNGFRLTHAQYEALERAITDGRRIVVTRRGTEFVVVPLGLRTVTGREVLDARHPTTGDSLTLVLDELDQLEPIPGR